MFWPMTCAWAFPLPTPPSMWCTIPIYWNIFSKRQGEFFVRECFRVLRPGGLLRLAVPDLEDIARAYLKTLEERG